MEVIETAIKYNEEYLTGLQEERELLSKKINANSGNIAAQLELIDSLHEARDVLKRYYEQTRTPTS